MTRIALDTNVLVYLSGIGRTEADRAKVDRARSLARGLASITTVLPVQVLGELFSVMRRYRIPDEEARQTIRTFGESYETRASDLVVAMDALSLATDHRLQFWDALIISAAAAAGCSLLLSEDMQDGFAVRGLTIVNPFAASLHPKLAQLLAP